MDAMRDLLSFFAASIKKGELGVAPNSPCIVDIYSTEII